MRIKNLFALLLVLTNLYLLFIVFQDKTKSTVEIPTNKNIADKERIVSLETSIQEISFAIKELKSAIQSLENSNKSNIVESNPAVVQSPKEIPIELQPYDEYSDIVQSTVYGMRLDNLPSGYLESRQAAYDLLLESDLFNEDEDN